MGKYFFIISLFISGFSYAQNNTQNIRGVVTDKLSQSSLAAVTLQITALQKGTSTDSLGKYSIANIHPDRYEIIISCMGYKNITIPNVVISSGKEVMLDITMEETFNRLREVVVKASNKGGSLTNWPV